MRASELQSERREREREPPSLRPAAPGPADDLIPSPRIQVDNPLAGLLGGWQAGGAAVDRPARACKGRAFVSRATRKGA